MQTAKITEMTTYSYLERSSDSSAYPVLALETAQLWTERSLWFGSDKREERRVLIRAEKGSRAGRSDSWSRRYWKTGIPVLRLYVMDRSFQASADPEHRIIDSAQDLLVRAFQRMKIMELVDSNESVFGSSDDGVRAVSKIRTKVFAQYADGETREVTVGLELVRPQTIIKAWGEHLTEVEAAAVAQAEYDKRVRDRKAENDKTAQDIKDRVAALLNRDKHDVQRHYSGYSTNGISTTYKLSEATLLELLAVAEKGSAQ